MSEPTQIPVVSPPPLRAVLEPRVLHGALLGSRASASVVDAWREGRVFLCVTEQIMREYFRLLGRIKANAPCDDVLGRLRSGEAVRAFVVSEKPFLTPGKKPSSTFEACLLACGAIADAPVLSYDRAFARRSRAVTVFSPATFVRRFLTSPPAAMVSYVPSIMPQTP